MFQGCLARIIPVAITLAIILWFCSHRSHGGLIDGLNPITGADSIGRFMSALVPSIEGLF